MLDRLQQKQQQEGQRTHANWQMSYNIPHRTPHNTRSSYQSVEVLLSLFKKEEELNFDGPKIDFVCTYFFSKKF